jgi:beta-galactosidase GanA
MPHQNLPRLERTGSHTRLIVDGKPFLCIGGELHNSSASNRDYMSPIWDKLAKAGINTVIAPVSWEQVEPVEGELDFSIVDSLV